MKKIFLFLFAAVIVAGCTISEKVVFNSKNGGTMSYTIDATEFVNFMNMSDSTGKGFNLGDSLAELQQSTDAIKKIKGIRNVDFKKGNSTVEFAFAFDNIEALNKAHVELGVRTENVGAGKSYEKVTVNNKKEWIYRTWPLGSSAEDSMYSTMGMMLTYNLDVTFPKEVVSTSSKTIKTAGQKIMWSSTGDDTGGTYAFKGITVKMK